MRLFRKAAPVTISLMPLPPAPVRTVGEMIDRLREIHATRDHPGTLDDCAPCVGYVLWADYRPVPVG